MLFCKTDIVQNSFNKRHLIGLYWLTLLLFFLFSKFHNNQQPTKVRTTSRAATTCSKSAIETPEQHCVIYSLMLPHTALSLICVFPKHLFYQHNPQDSLPYVFQITSGRKLYLLRIYNIY